MSYRQYFTRLDLSAAKCTILFMANVLLDMTKDGVNFDLICWLEVVICNLPEVKLFCELVNTKHQYENRFDFQNAIFFADSK